MSPSFSFGTDGVSIGRPSRMSFIAVSPACCSCTASFAPCPCTTSATDFKPGMKRSSDIATWRQFAEPTGQLMAIEPMISSAAPPSARAP